MLDRADEPFIEQEIETPAEACRSSYWTLRGREGIWHTPSLNSSTTVP
jgi:hypothetical protein